RARAERQIEIGTRALDGNSSPNTVSAAWADRPAVNSFILPVAGAGAARARRGRTPAHYNPRRDRPGQTPDEGPGWRVAVISGSHQQGRRSAGLVSAIAQTKFGRNYC